MPSASAEVQSQKCQSPPAVPHCLDAQQWRFSLWELCCSVTWLSLSFLPPQQTRTSRTMTRWTAAAPRPRPKEPRCPGGRRWAWVHFNALPPAASLQVRTTASPPKFIHEDVKKNKMTVFAFCGSVILSAVFSAGRDGSSAGAVDEEDFIQAFEDVPTVQVSTYVTCTSNGWPSPSAGSKTPARVWTFSSLSPPSDLL